MSAGATKTDAQRICALAATDLIGAQELIGQGGISEA
jgi:hypothetical protein